MNKKTKTILENIAIAIGAIFYVFFVMFMWIFRKAFRLHKLEKRNVNNNP